MAMSKSVSLVARNVLAVVSRQIPPWPAIVVSEEEHGCSRRVRASGSYRAAGEVCGADPKTVKRKVLAHDAGLLDDQRAERAPVPKNTDGVRTVVLDLVRDANGRGTANRLLAHRD
jgi:hypothetical protein